MRIIGKDGNTVVVQLVFKNNKLIEYKSDIFSKADFNMQFKKGHGSKNSENYFEPETPENAWFVLKHCMWLDVEVLDGELPKFEYEKGAIY